MCLVAVMVGDDTDTTSFTLFGVVVTVKPRRTFHASGVRPCGWTESSWRFDRLAGVLILELRWAEIA
jgi:hypothetical protein